MSESFNHIKKLDRIIGIPLNFSLGIFKIKKNPIPKSIKKVLFIRLGNIGDAVLSIPTLREFKRNFPKTKIYVLTSSRTGKIYDNVPYLDKIIDFNLEEDEGIIKSTSKNLSILKGLISKLRKEKFDIIFDLETYSRVTPIITFFSKPKFSISYDSEKQYRAFLYDKKLEYPWDRHEVECFLDIIRHLDVKIKNKELEYQVKKDRFVDNLLKENEISKKDKFVIIHPGNNVDWQIKRWPKERFAKVAKRIVKEYGFKVILIGSKTDIELNEEVMKLSKLPKKKIFNLAGKTNIKQLAYLISLAKLYIGNDTGPMHLSAAVQTPTIGIFGPPSPKKWGPYGKKHSYVWKGINPYPCWNLGKLNCTCPTFLLCELSITVEDVMKEINNTIKKNEVIR